MAESVCVSSISDNLESLPGSSEPQPVQCVVELVSESSNTNPVIIVKEEINVSPGMPSKVEPIDTTSNQNNNNDECETPKPLSILHKPPRNKLLTSLILSPEEITKEIIERAEKKRPPQIPEGGDLLFQKQLTKRLAEKVVKEELLNRPVPVELLTPPPPPPKVQKLNNDHSDMDAQKLLSILQEGAEIHYSEKLKPPKPPRTPVKGETDRELEKELALKQLMEVSHKRKSKTENNNNVASPKISTKPKRLNKELANLLSDEGAINMLYDIEKGETIPKKTALPSIRRQKKALLKKAQEVKQAILDGSAINKGLRLRHPVDCKKKDSEDNISFTAPAEASKIIRRHSSSSSYSSRGSSPRRTSGEYERHRLLENGEDVSENGVNLCLTENGPNGAQSPKKSLHKPKRVNPEESTSIRLNNDKNGFKEKLQTEFSNKFKSIMVKQAILSVKRSNEQKQEPGVFDRSKDSESPSPSKSTCEAIWKMLQDDWSCAEDGEESVDDPDPPSNGRTAPIAASTPCSTLSTKVPNLQISAKEQILSPGVSLPLSTPVKVKETIVTIKNEIAPLPPTEPENEVIPENKNDVPFVHKFQLHLYRELMLRRIGPLVHVNIAPVSTRLVQAFNIQVLKELTTMLEEVSIDCRCKAVLLTCSGKLFSFGVDLPILLQESAIARAAAARELSTAIKDFIQKLAMFKKPVIVGVVGPCIGLGVTMLAYCDIVYASPSAMFSTPYAKLGYIPEAAASLALPLIIGHRMTTSMLIGGRKLSAEEALSCGLVTATIPEDDFISEVVENAFKIASQSSQCMESTKVMLMHSIRSRLSAVLSSETTLLQQHWPTRECQQRILEASEKLLSE